MAGVKNAEGILKKIFLVLMVTVVPVAIVIRLWQIILIYWQLIMSVLLMGSGGIFYYFYIKIYSLDMVILKFRKWYNGITGLVEVLPKPLSENTELKGSKNFLYLAFVFAITGLYLFVQFKRTH